jgi:hypothetical protein
MAMECERCHAMMIEESFDDVKADTWLMEFRGWRCPLCGNVLDPVILANRATIHGVLAGGARKRRNAQAL